MLFGQKNIQVASKGSDCRLHLISGWPEPLLVPYSTLLQITCCGSLLFASSKCLHFLSLDLLADLYYVIFLQRPLSHMHAAHGLCKSYIVIFSCFEHFSWFVSTLSSLVILYITGKVFNTGIKHVFLCINICWTLRAMLKPEPEGSSSC